MGTAFFSVVQYGLLFLKKKIYLFVFRERVREGERGRETSMCGCLSRAPNWGPGLQPRQCPEWESNPLPSGSQSGTQSTEPHQPELIDFCFKSLYTAQNWSDTCVMLPLCRKPHRHCCGLRCVFLLCFSL